MAAGLVSIFPTSRLFCDLHFYYDDDDDERDERDNSLFHPLDEVNVEHLQTTTTRKREMACRLLHIGSQKIRISSLPVVCLEGNTNTQLVFLFLFIPR